MTLKLVAEVPIRINNRRIEKGTRFETNNKTGKELLREGHASLIEKEIFKQYPTIKIKNPLNKDVVEMVAHVKRSPFYAGGRVYFKMMVLALLEMGADVITYTDDIHENSVFNFNDLNYFVVDELPEADLYLCVLNDIEQIKKASDRYGKPVILFAFDSLTNLLKYVNDEDGRLEEEKNFYNDKLDFLLQQNVRIVTISEFARKGILEWTGKDSRIVNPCVDYSLVESIPKQKKEDWITFIGRLDVNKRPYLMLDIFEHFKDKYELHIITSFLRDTEWGNRFKKKADMMGVKFHWLAREEEKYEILKKSKLSINTSSEEGWGMFVAESQACGVPFVGFDLPTYREIRKELDIGINLATNKAEFIDLMDEALDDGCFRPVCIFDKKRFKKQVREIILNARVSIKVRGEDTTNYDDIKLAVV